MRRKVDHDKSDGLCGTLFEPGSDWKCPTNFPNIDRSTNIIGIDVESKDPSLSSRGPGFIRGDAQITGISVATNDRSWYYPLRHLGGGNHPNPESVFAFIRDLVAVPDRFVCGANLQYELEALESEGIVVHGRLLDVQIAEALIDEEQDEGYSLEQIALKHLGERKDERLLKLAADAYGFTNVKANLWKLPAKYVGPYGEWDSMAPLKIFAKQKKILEQEDLLSIFEIESKLLPVLWKMRKQGIPIDLEAADKLSKELKVEEDAVRSDFFKKQKYFIDEWSGPMLKRLFDNLGLQYPTTDKGNASFEGEFLDSFADPTIQMVAKLRDLNRMRTTFVDKWIFGNEVKGRIHPQWKQLVSDDGGARTGRMACANPNAQQVPAGKFRTTGKPNPIGKAIRALFVSDTGKWAKFDYKQQEPRILTHFSNLCEFTGAKIAAMAYRTNPNMDFYQYMVEIAQIDRRPAKDMYLGRCYGMGKKKLAKKLGKTVEECERILNEFDSKIPFVKEIAESCELNAQRRGYIRTLLGRRRHFNHWEPVDRWKRSEAGEYITPQSRKDAEEKWPGVKLVRSDTRKALNALIQGSAADMVKAALLQIHDDLKTIPYMAVHDELDIGVQDDDHAEKCKNIIEHCVDMTVPVYTDMEVGKHWK
jgi:DNA polymerase I-like protein with 3'-5' exonuclease and polymerase domains